MPDAGPYRPSNGSEGADFMRRFCDRCERDRAFLEGASGEGCDLVVSAMLFRADEPGFPHEWCYGEDGPTCTAFQPSPDVSPSDIELEAAGQLPVFPNPSTVFTG